ncbi:MAG: DUF2723 domain-containing protein [Flavobacteriaceae bacterium]|nr:DUF2723 domain-containing protein [Flavobacteriaceae bacterium]
MTSSNYNKWNIILGWVAFSIALITYTLTIEPTVSFWDCGEYISTSVKLEVGHPPGAPLYQMLGAFFGLFTSDVTQLALVMNFMSALASAFTILFLFWTITYFARKLISSSELTKENGIIIFGSGLVGALAYTFSDSFWFSAVEAEVYAMSSFLMALLFWLGLRWIDEIDSPRGNKWLLLISFVVGLSFGVHILSLLVIPAIVYLFLLKKYIIDSYIKFIIANIIAVVVLIFVFKLLFPYTLKFFSASELFFINTVGLPFNSGSIIAAIILIAGFYFGLSYTRKHGKVLANTVILSILFVMIGFSSWIMLPIRANTNTTINENNPSSARELLAYYNREQYGDANVFFDTYYSVVFDRELDENEPYVDEKPKYEKDETSGKYIIVNNYEKATPNYSDKHKGFIPRMVNPAAVKNYKAIAGIPKASERRPTFAENIYFMINYQFGYMYGRYFMWNFVGKQNDEQGYLDINNGNWLSGINFLDEFRLGPQSDLPSDIANNKGRNTYYFLPFLLGLLGFFYQLKKDKKNLYPLLLFFAFTGLAIIFYTNPKPFEPRERDYAVVGSFYIFAIWIGIGVLALFDYLRKFTSHKSLAIGVVSLSLLAVPTIMASENWDDHDRSGRYTTNFVAKSYLDSCDENAIMFTIGDNDTFPLWYLQEVENYRTDLKLINTSLFNTDWYIDQMKRKTYIADPIPGILTHEMYKQGSLEVAYHVPRTENRIDIKDFMKWIASSDEATYVETNNGHKEKTYPTNKLRLYIDKEAVLRNKILPLKYADSIVSYIDIDIDDQGISKSRILMLDILANNNWKHPIYFTGGSHDDEEYIWLKDYLQLDGTAYKFVPMKTSNKDKTAFDMGHIDSETMYSKMMKWDWDIMSKPNVYLDIETRKNSVTLRNNLIRLADVLIQENQLVKAEQILDLSIEKMPVERYGHYGMVLGYVESYYMINKPEKARKLANLLTGKFQENLLYYSRFDEKLLDKVFDEIETNVLMYKNIVDVTSKYDEQNAQKMMEDFNSHVQLFKNILE